MGPQPCRIAKRLGAQLLKLPQLQQQGVRTDRRGVVILVVRRRLLQQLLLPAKQLLLPLSQLLHKAGIGAPRPQQQIQQQVTADADGNLFHPVQRHHKQGVGVIDIRQRDEQRRITAEQERIAEQALLKQRQKDTQPQPQRQRRQVQQRPLHKQRGQQQRRHAPDAGTGQPRGPLDEA